jgi:HSP20 family protein
VLVRQVWPSRPTFDSPFADIDSLRREMMRALYAVSGDAFTEATGGVFPPVNVTQDDENFYLRAEVPGIKPSELSISALKNRGSLSGRLTDGVLRLELPKVESARPRQINVRSE